MSAKRFETHFFDNVFSPPWEVSLAHNFNKSCLKYINKYILN